MSEHDPMECRVYTVQEFHRLEAENTILRAEAGELWELLDALRAEAGRLQEALEFARSAIDRLMGDSDLEGDDE